MRRRVLLLLTLASLVAVSAAWRVSARAGAGSPAPGTIETIAGGGTQTGDGIPATDEIIDLPYGIAVNSNGDVFFSDYTRCVIRKLSQGVSTIYAGTGTCPTGQSVDVGDGGLATSAVLDYPTGLAVDSAGNLYIADKFNCAVRKVDAVTTVISTVAGRPGYCFTAPGNGGPATEASLALPDAVAIDSNNNFYIAEECGVRVVTGGIISNFAGNGTCSYSGDGGPAVAAGVGDPLGLAVDANGDLYVSQSCRLREVSGGIINTVAGNENCYFNGDGPALSTSVSPFLLATDPSGNVYFADDLHCRIRRLKDGAVTTLAGRNIPTIIDPFPDCGYSGDGGSALNAQVEEAIGVAIDNDGNVYLTEFGNYANPPDGSGHVRVVYDPLDAPATPTYTATPTASETPTPTDTPTATPTRVPSCADFDRSGTVGIGDVMLVIHHFGASESNADLTGDGKVTVADILAAIHQYGRHC